MTLLQKGWKTFRQSPPSIQLRSFSVKELSWCKPNTQSPTKHGSEETQSSQIIDPEEVSSIEWEPIHRFGIVAAMSKNRVIGLHGKLPWNIPNDRKHFQDLTRNKIIIVGCKTYYDTPCERNISHARHCIVVSTTAKDDLGSDKVHVARSFSEALHLAKKLQEPIQSLPHIQPIPLNNPECWVCGGERIYMEALHHKAAQELHLTLVDTMVDVTPLESGQTPEVALFPAKYRWDRHFKEVSRRREAFQGSDVPYCTYVVYRRKCSMK